jgi:hypothetical protein
MDKREHTPGPWFEEDFEIGSENKESIFHIESICHNTWSVFVMVHIILMKSMRSKKP